jgi:hypothetical protein
MLNPKMTSKNEFDITCTASYTGKMILAKIRAGCLSELKFLDLRKIGIWSLLIAYVVAAIILAAAGTPAVTVETFTLILSLEIIAAFSFMVQQRISIGYCFEIRPRSPPAN